MIIEIKFRISYQCWSSSKIPHEMCGNPPENIQQNIWQ